MCATIGVTGYPRYASCLRGRAIAPRRSRRLCAAAGTLPPPLLGGRTIGRADHLRHFRASLPTQEPNPHGGPFFSCWATPSAPATGASTKCNHISGRLYSPPVGVPNHLLLCMWAEAKEFEGSPPPQPVITPISDSLGDCAVSLGSSCARPRARSAVTIARVAPNVSACGRSVHLGGGDADRAHI